MAPLRQLNRAPVGGHPAAAVGGTAARLPAVIPWEPLATGGVLSISSPARAGASEARKPRGCEGSAGRLADGAGSRESRGQCGRGEHGKPAARGPPRPPPRPAMCVGAVATRLLRGPSPACKHARPGGGAERPGSAFRLRKAFGVPRDELADGPESQPCPCCRQASAARSAWSTCPWIVPRLRPPHPRVFSKRRGSFPAEPRARAVISLRISSSTAFLPGESASPSGKGRRLPRGLRHRRPLSLRHPIAGSRKGVTRAHHTNGGGRNPSPGTSRPGLPEAARPADSSEGVSQSAVTYRPCRATDSWLKSLFFFFFFTAMRLFECILENWSLDITFI